MLTLNVFFTIDTESLSVYVCNDTAYLFLCLHFVLVLPLFNGVPLRVSVLVRTFAVGVDIVLVLPLFVLTLYWCCH